MKMIYKFYKVYGTIQFEFANFANGRTHDLSKNLRSFANEQLVRNLKANCFHQNDSGGLIIQFAPTLHSVDC